MYLNFFPVTPFEESFGSHQSLLNASWLVYFPKPRPQDPTNGGDHQHCCSQCRPWRLLQHRSWPPALFVIVNSIVVLHFDKGLFGFAEEKWNLNLTHNWACYLRMLNIEANKFHAVIHPFTIMVCKWHMHVSILWHTKCFKLMQWESLICLIVRRPKLIFL